MNLHFAGLKIIVGYLKKKPKPHKKLFRENTSCYEESLQIEFQCFQHPHSEKHHSQSWKQAIILCLQPSASADKYVWNKFEKNVQNVPNSIKIYCTVAHFH